MAKKEGYRDELDENGKFAKGNQLHRLRENVGRPSKLGRFIQEFQCVITHPHPVGRAIMFTDAELLFLTNRRLEPPERIDDSTFARWKKFEFVNDKDQAMAEEFRLLYQEALLSQREGLFEAMVSKAEQRSWGRYMSIIERKFDEWNLRHKTEDETVDRKQLVFRVEGDG